MNLRHNIKRILREESKMDLSPFLEKLVTNFIVNNNRDIICRVKVKHPDNRTKLPHSDNVYLHYRVDVKFIGGYGTEHWPVTQAVANRYDKIINDVWDLIYDTTGKSVDIFSEKLKNCD
jgi:hypothetical protein